MARTRNAEVGIEPVDEEVVLGPEDGETEVDEGAPTDADEAGGDAVDADGEEAEGEEAEAVDEPPARRGGGGAVTPRNLRARAQQAETRAAALERENAELRGFQAGAATTRQPADPQAAARAEAEFYQSLELMPPGQAYQALLQRGEQRVGAYIQGIEFRTNDRLDKQAYDAAARTDPIYAKYRAQVEQVLADERRAGRNSEREVILDVLYGREMRERVRSAAGRQRPAAAARVAGQRTQPTGARSNSAPGNRRPQPGSPEHDEMVVNAAIARGESVF